MRRFDLFAVKYPSLVCTPRLLPNYNIFQAIANNHELPLTFTLPAGNPDPVPNYFLNNSGYLNFDLSPPPFSGIIFRDFNFDANETEMAQPNRKPNLNVCSTNYYNSSEILH